MFRARLSDLLVDALQVLNRRNRLLLLPRIAAVYREQFQRSRGFLDVWVTSAVELTPEERARLSNLVRRRTGRQANLQLRVDPSLIGGLVVRIGDEKFDRSIANELVRLETKLLERASREIIADRTRAQGERTP
jgi:F-type H+-transporting ATPase subunit delta